MYNPKKKISTEKDFKKKFMANRLGGGFQGK
jgi:hypothetical protein